MNLKKLRESKSIAADLGHAGQYAQSKSAGEFLGDSPLDVISRNEAGSPTSDSSSVSDNESDLFDSSSMHSPRALRSRSLTLPFKSPQPSFLEGVDDNDEVNDFDPLNDSPSRMTSHPIRIVSYSKPRSHGAHQSNFPLTDGAMAEFAALSSTPLSNPGFLI
jgi:hypothetical protein